MKRVSTFNKKDNYNQHPRWRKYHSGHLVSEHRRRSMFNNTCHGVICSLQPPVDSPPVPLGHSGSTKQQFLKESQQLRIKGMWGLVSSLKKNELNISMTRWVFLLRGGRDCGENNFFNSLFFKTVIRIIYQMWGKEPRYLVSKTQVQNFLLSQSLLLNTSEGTNAAATVGETCSRLDAAQNFLISSETNTGMSFFAVVRPCVFWVSKQMHLEGLRCARSKIEIWEAVLELKRGRIFRDYSNENLSEAYKNSVLSIIFNWYLMATFPGKDRLRAVISRSKTSQLLKVGPPRGERHTLLWSLEFFFFFFFF